jgi:hypothetical protein
MEEKRERWLNYCALITVLLALGATLSTLRMGSYTNRSILRQTQASDQWAFYQSKSIKSYLYELQKDKMELEVKLLKETGAKDAINDYGVLITNYTTKLKKYEDEKTQIKKEAEGLEAQRDVAIKHGQAFGVAVILLQLAILLSSIAALMKKPSVWVIGLILGAAGLICFLNGFFMFIPSVKFLTG